MRLKGQVALVTGASRGIGRAVARRLAGAGARVYLAARDEAALNAVAGEIREEGGDARGARMDLRDPEEVQRVVRDILEGDGRIDVLVNNAGLRRDKLLVRIRPEDWEDVLAVNLTGAFHCLRNVVTGMSRQRYGRIVNVTSVVAFTGNAGQANYAAAKAGLVGLTKSAAREYASRGVTVNAVAPGFVETEMLAGMEARARQEIMGHIPLGRIGSAEEVAHAVAFLCAPEAGYITGQVLHVNGGLYV